MADAASLAEITEELADVMEVVLAIAKANGISMGDVEKFRILKHSESGGFEGRVYVSSVESDAEQE